MHDGSRRYQFFRRIPRLWTREVRGISLRLRLNGLESLEVFDGVVDGARRQDGVELAPGSGGIVLGEDAFDDFFSFLTASPFLGWCLPSGL